MSKSCTLGREENSPTWCHSNPSDVCFCTHKAVGTLQKLEHPGAQSYNESFCFVKKPHNEILTNLDSLCLWILNFYCAPSPCFKLLCWESWNTLLLLKWEQAFLCARWLQEPSLKESTKYFQVSGFRKEPELSSWELAAYIVFMHELHRDTPFIVRACAAVHHLRCVVLFIW